MDKKKRTVAKGDSYRINEVCTFQVHYRKRIGGRLKPSGSKSITKADMNVSLEDGLKIVRLGIEAFKALNRV